ncbi:MAG: hypothetical protein HY038_10210 [Nitrospirae bacterium]|nr:hypothetical protein [Nitrospirota bacterium]
MEPTLTTPAPAIPAPTTKVRTKTAKPCTHRRLVDEVRSANGTKTARLICLECLAEFPDPTYQAPGT